MLLGADHVKSPVFFADQAEIGLNLRPFENTESLRLFLAKSQEIRQ